MEATSTKGPKAYTSPSAMSLVERLALARRAEEEARARRIELEEELIAATGFDRAEGQETIRITDGAGARCTVVMKQPVSAKVDASTWEEIRRTLPKGHPGRRLFRTRYDLAVGDARKLQERDPAMWRDVARAVTRKPGKISVSIQSLES